MNDSEKIREWARFYDASPPGYQIHALVAVFKNDGEQMLAKVLRELKLETPIALVKACRQ